MTCMTLFRVHQFWGHRFPLLPHPPPRSKLKPTLKAITTRTRRWGPNMHMPLIISKGISGGWVSSSHPGTIRSNGEDWPSPPTFRFHDSITLTLHTSIRGIALAYDWSLLRGSRCGGFEKAGPRSPWRARTPLAAIVPNVALRSQEYFAAGMNNMKAAITQDTNSDFWDFLLDPIFQV
ncbi:hypothetical protein HOY82DRAFT_536295 [Tuber indicum]|nr:hypothetical protein HOY82DRAFT_536295 [Tuber indicum]